jgi:hypothetical protein
MKVDREQQRQRTPLPVFLADEPADMFPPAVRPRVFFWLWLSLAVLLVTLAILIVDYRHVAGQ